jgi:hypothetical protein
MPITYYDPNRPQQRQYEFILQMLGNFAMQKRAQESRAKEADIQRTHAETLQMVLAGFQTEAPTDKKTTTPTGGTRRVPSDLVQPDIVIGGRKYYGGGFKPQTITVGGQKFMKTHPLGRWQHIPGTVSKDPKTREVKRGDKVITEELDRSTGTWKQVGEGPRYKPTTIINMPAAVERERLASGAATLDSLDNLRTLYNDNYVGPLEGRWGMMKDVFGQNPQEQSNFYAASSALENAVIKEITGAQMGEAEATRIKRQVPRPTDHPKAWVAKWKQSVRNVAMLRKRRMEIMEKSGLKVPEPEKKIPPQADPLGIMQ